MAEDRFSFHVEWFDAQADLLRRYTLTYYPRDNTFDMYDPKAKRPFLKRTEQAGVKLSDLYIGAVVTVVARQLKVLDYGDAYTRNALESSKSRTLALVKPDAYNHIGTVLSAVTGAGFVVAKLQMIKLTGEQAEAFCRLSGGQDGPEHAAHLSSDVVVAMELVGSDAIAVMKSLAGPRDPRVAQSSAPRSLCATLGTDSVKNAVHASDGPAAAGAELQFFFGGGVTWPTTAVFNNCTLAAVRPHAFSGAGEIVSRILAEGFEISAMRIWHMDKATSEEFLEVYKGVLPEYHECCGQLCTGPSLVMEVRQEDAVASFRKLAGPMDPEVAKHLRPTTIRAKHGIDRVKNGIHCTDLSEDGLLEVEYFFNILSSRG